MTLRYLVAHSHGRLYLARRAWVEALWRGERRVHVPGGGPPASELRLISVLCNKRLLPQKIYLLRLPLTDGRFTSANRRALRSFSMPSRVTASEMFQHHSEGWPRDFFAQMAVALDVPRSFLEVPLGIGGPLLMAAALRLPPRQAARYLR
jgi:hypothetical protein